MLYQIGAGIVYVECPVDAGLGLKVSLLACRPGTDDAHEAR